MSAKNNRRAARKRPPAGQAVSGKTRWRFPPEPPVEADAAPVEYAGLLTARGHYAAAYSKWLQAVAYLASESTIDDDDAEEDAAAKLLAIRPPLKWMIWYKFEVLERALESEDCAGVRERERELHALAAIRADLVHFGFDAP
jgi:hypothetical protein